MAYSKVNFVDGTTPLNATTFDQMDQGIADVEAAAVPKATVDAAGDLIVGMSPDQVARLPVSPTDAYVLTADLAQPLKMRWAAPAGGGGSTDLVYNGEYPAATPYTDGDIVIYQGQAYLCVRPTSSPPTPWVGAALPGLVKLGEVVLGAASPTLADFTNIDQTFTDLILRGVCRYDQAAAGVAQMRMNGDTGANYDYENLQASGASASGAAGIAASNFYAAIIAGTSIAAGIVSGFDIVIPGYTGTVLGKSIMSRHGYGGVWSMLSVGGWRGTTAINRITITPSAGNFIAGSRVTLWGQR